MMLISIGMGIVFLFSQGVSDYLLWVRQNKWRFLLCWAICLVGFATGIVIFANSASNWWYANRLNFANTLVLGNFFGVFFQLLLQWLCICLVYMLSNCIKYLCFVRYVGVFLCCLYSGATLFAIFLVVGALGILYLLYFLMGIFLCTFLLQQQGCATDYFKSPREVWQDCKGVVLLVGALTLARFLILFVILRPISTAI